MSEEQRATSLNGLAKVIARRLQAIRDIAAEKGEEPPAGEIARQFQTMCERATLYSGPISTAEMQLLATKLVPEPTAWLQNPERLSVTDSSRKTCGDQEPTPLAPSECDFNIVDRVQTQSSLYMFFLGFCFAARRAQPAIPEEFLKSLGRSSGVTFVKAANSRALDHLLFCFGSKAWKVASINVLAGLDPFLCGMLKYSAT
jgi:hypothetical protein